ncbi:MAG TPA: flagellar hook-length control protein FliK, partial [Stellaceae bacterium]|nr:flagellar hook-length control protein FliK [Stellaceae bacterium]
GAAATAAGDPTPPAAAAPSASPGAPPPAMADPADVAGQLSGRMVRLLAGSGREAVVRLHPPGLGEVTVRVAVTGRDVSAWFGSPQAAVQQTISLGLGQLQADLGNAGYNLAGAWVGADASGSGSGGERPVPPPVPAIDAVRTAPAGAAAALSSNAGVSIYV